MVIRAIIHEFFRWKDSNQNPKEHPGELDDVEEGTRDNDNKDSPGH